MLENSDDAAGAFSANCPVTFDAVMGSRRACTAVAAPSCVEDRNFNEPFAPGTDSELTPSFIVPENLDADVPEAGVVKRRSLCVEHQLP